MLYPRQRCVGKVISDVCDFVFVFVSVCVVMLKRENGLSYPYQTWYRHKPVSCSRWPCINLEVKRSKVTVTQLSDALLVYSRQ